MICVSLSDLGQLDRAVAAGIELVELRLDLLREDPEKLYRHIPDHVRSIATCRPGNYTDDKRLALLSSCLSLGAAYVDVEIESQEDYLQALTGAAHSNNAGVIVSYHNFENTPDRNELEGVMLACYEKGGDVAKIATRVVVREDLVSLLGLYNFPGRKVIIGMGPEGKITRVAALYLGAEFTFASLEQGGETAPGQLSLNQLKNIYKAIDTP